MHSEFGLSKIYFCIILKRIFNENDFLSPFKNDLLKCSTDEDCHENASCFRNDYTEAGFQINLDWGPSPDGWYGCRLWIGV